jgi:uncharacterized protein DUF4331
MTHRTWIAAGLLLPLCFVGRSEGSDHADSPSVLGKPEADLNDLFVFVPPGDDSHLVLALSVNGFANDAALGGGNTIFGPDTLYTFHIDNDFHQEPGDSPEEIRIDIQVNVETDTEPADSVIRITGLPSLNGGAETVLALDDQGMAEQGDVRVFAGLRDDPFYFDLRWFTDFPSGHPFASLNDGVDFYHMGVPDAPSAPADTFAGYNVSMIVLEFPKKDVQRSENDTTIGVWASTGQL